MMAMLYVISRILEVAVMKKANVLAGSRTAYQQMDGCEVIALLTLSKAIAQAGVWMCSLHVIHLILCFNQVSHDKWMIDFSILCVMVWVKYHNLQERLEDSVVFPYTVICIMFTGLLLY